MSPPTRFTASQAKQQFGELLNRCVYGGERVVITKHDKPVAVLIRMEDYRGTEAKPRGARKEIPPASERPDHELPPILREARELRRQIATYQASQGTKDTRTAVEWIRMIRDENDG